jgi:hypothetical protein
MRTAFVLLLLAATPAMALDWHSNRAEYWPEVLQARAEYKLNKLNCAEMNALIEMQRACANEQALNQFGRVRPAGWARPSPTSPAPGSR